MMEKGMGELTSQMIADIEKIRRGFEIGSRVGVTQLGRSTQWREDLERLAAMEVVERNQTAAILLKPELFKALMKYIDQMDHDLEQAQVEAIFGHRKETTEFLSGEDLAIKAKEHYKAERKSFQEFLDGDK